MIWSNNNVPYLGRRIRKMMLRATFIIYSVLLSSVDSMGRQLFDCPDGFYLSDFVSAFGGQERLYNFGCLPLTTGLVTNETCTRSNAAESQNGDMFLYCKNNEYVAGVSILEDLKQQRWTLLCCKSPHVKIRENDCISTSFLNNYKLHFSFSSQRQIIRKFQSIFEEKEKDRRWWVQVCPIDVEEPEEKPLVKERFTRNAASEFGPSRFSTLPRVPLKKLRVIPEKFKPKPVAIASYSFGRETQHFPVVSSSTAKPSTSRSFSGNKKYAGWQFRDQLKLNLPVLTFPPDPYQKFITKKPFDYSDYYDDIPAASEDAESGFLGGLLRNLQDGLTFAEFAFGPTAPKEEPPPSRVYSTKQKFEQTYALNADAPSEHATVVVNQRLSPASSQLEPSGGTLQNIFEGLGLCRSRRA